MKVGKITKYVSGDVRVLITENMDKQCEGALAPVFSGLCLEDDANSHGHSLLAHYDDSWLMRNFQMTNKDEDR